jgi:uncharacterized protein YidB (DUF937 family)
MGLLDEVIGAIQRSTSPAAQGRSSQSTPAQDQFSQVAVALRELLAPKAAASPAAQPAATGQQGSSGLDVLLRQFQQNGFGEIINSWIGTGQNQPISPTQLRQAMGQQRINDISENTGVPHDDLLSQLSKILPEVVDKLTPNGKLPSQADLRSG